MCIFCEIINGNIPSQKVYEDDKIIAFKDLNPVAPVHFLVVPKQHIENLNGINEQNIGYVSHIFEKISEIASSQGIESYRVINNCGASAGQTVMHLHFHVIGGTTLGADCMNKTYKLKIAGLERNLNMFSVSDDIDIAAFIMFGDVELAEACARDLLKKCPPFDYIITPEAKSIPLAHEMSRQSGKRYIVARKGTKVYMDNPVKVTVNSITTQKEQSLFLGHEDGNLIKGKRVLIVDDVISTGDSLKAVQEIVKSFSGEIVACAAPLAEGDAAKRNDIIFLEKLPLFFK